jgi:acetolactate synthase-1/2/3 large subunit
MPDGRILVRGESGAQFLAEALDGFGATHVFFVPAILLRTLAELEGFGISRVLAHSEIAAAYMADGYARASGRPGICMAQNIGASNLAAGLRDAFMAKSPVIALTGGPTPRSRHRNYYQEIEDFSQFEPVTKFNAAIDIPDRLPDLLSQAFRVATTGAPGPVHLQMAGVTGEIPEAAARLETLIDPRFGLVPPFRPEPDPEALSRAARRLAEADRPLIVIGGGAVRSRAQGEILALAEKRSIPVATSLNAKGAIPDGHELSVGVVGTYSRACANRALAEADLVFFIGSQTGGQVTTHWQLPSPGTPIIQLDIDPAELGRNYANTLPILGDAREGVRRLLDLVEPAPAGGWAARIQALVADWREEERPHLDSEAVPLRPERLCRAISDALPANGVVVSDTGHSGLWSGTMIDLDRPGQRYFRCAGSLGWALPAALGVKCALPDRPVVCFAGDGAALYHIAELETAARQGIDTVVVVNNNAALNQEIHLFEEAYGGRPHGRWEELWRFRPVNFARVAEEFGCVGIRVEHPGQLDDALRHSFTLGRPVVIDVVTDISAFARAPWAPQTPPSLAGTE